MSKNNSDAEYELVLGFETHIELSTNSKMFCGCPADHFGKTPNSQTCPVCLGLPGALPVPNSKAIEWCIKLGLALDCKINLFSKFDRKNYFYPDLPKGYQISQYDQPFCYEGSLTLLSGKVIRVTRVHMEEDTGKLQHAEVDGKKVTLVDFNRSGVPLVEIVTEPDFSNPDEAIEFLKEIQLIVRAIGISSADMEKGSMRLEANISVRPKGQKELPKYKIEVKNVNSFRFIKKAIEFEFDRQLALLKLGEVPHQETRGFNEDKGETFSQRSKEEAHDYRYFPEPDIPPLSFTTEQIDKWRNSLPKLPVEIRRDLISRGVSQEKASILVSDQQKLNMITKLVQKDIELAKAVDMIINSPSDISGDTDKIILWAKQKETITVSTSELTEVAAKVVAANPKAVLDYQAGKEQSLFYMVGLIKKQLGNIDISLVRQAILDLIK